MGHTLAAAGDDGEVAGTAAAVSASAAVVVSLLASVFTVVAEAVLGGKVAC